MLLVLYRTHIDVTEMTQRDMPNILTTVLLRTSTVHYNIISLKTVNIPSTSMSLAPYFEDVSFPPVSLCFSMSFSFRLKSGRHPMLIQLDFWKIKKPILVAYWVSIFIVHLSGSYMYDWGGGVNVTLLQF